MHRLWHERAGNVKRPNAQYVDLADSSKQAILCNFLAIIFDNDLSTQSESLVVSIQQSIQASSAFLSCKITLIAGFPSSLAQMVS